jgi:hypothetical protein
VVGVAVVAGGEVGGRHDVDAGLEHPLVELEVGPDAVEGHAVGLRVEVRLPPQPADHLGPDVAGGHLEDADPVHVHS